MDSLENGSPSKSYQSSLGLIDENLIDDTSFGNKSNELKSSFLKPQTNLQLKQFNKSNDGNLSGENVADNADVTVNNIIINESELNDLENDFSGFSVENDSNETNDSDKNLKDFVFKSNDFDTQSKIAAFLSNDNDIDFDNPRRSRELSCIHEEDHHELNQTATVTNYQNEFEGDNNKVYQNVNESVNKDANLMGSKFDVNEINCNKTNLITSINLNTSDLSSCYSIEKAKDIFFDDPVMVTTPTPIITSKVSKLNPTAVSALTNYNKNDLNDDTRDDCLSSFNNLNNTSRNMDFTLQNNSPQINNSKQYDASMSSIYFKPSKDIISTKTTKNDSISNNDTFRLSNKFDHNFSQNIANGTLDKMFEKKEIMNDVDAYGFGDSSMNGALQQALFNEQQLGISMGEFKSGEELLNEFDMMQTTRDIDEQSWWNVNSQQPSKLDLSNMTTTSAASSLSTTSTASSITSNDKKSSKTGNAGVAVDEYFNRKSCLPSYLIDEHKSLLNLSKEFSANDQTNNTTTTVAPKIDNKSKLNPDHSVLSTTDKSNLTDFTFSIPTVTHIDNGFSFTLNSSDNGEFIQKLDKNKSENINDNINSTLKHESVGVKPPALNTKPINPNSVNIKEIGEDLNRISNLLSNRLALNENKNKTTDKVIVNETLQKSTTSTILKDNNLKNKTKLTGSITSTPAKLQAISSNLISTSTKTTTTTSAINTDNQQNNHLFNQESFISSIPDRNDTDSDATVTSCDNELNNKNFKKPQNVRCNAEIQTSPLKVIDNNDKFNNGINSANTTTTSLSSIISSAAAAAAANAVNNTGLNGVIPVAFLPIQALLPCMQKLYDDSQTTSILTQTLNKMFSQSQLQQAQSSQQNLFDYENLSQLSKQLQFQQQRQKSYDLFNPNLPDRDFSSFDNRLSLNSQLGVGNQRNISNQIPMQSAQVQLPPQPLRLPQIEVDKYILEFNCIAEGCHDFRSFLLKEILNPTPVIYGANYYILVEINETRFKINNNTTSLSENELKIRLSKIFSLSLTATPTSTNNQRSNFIKLETSSGKLFEINFHVDTLDLNLYKELFNIDKQRKYKPFEISLTLTISCCFENQKSFLQPQNQQPKYLLNQIDIKLLLGYARLKTNANTADTIDFIIEKKILKNRIDYAIDESNKEKIIPISNGGNVPINVKCYLDDDSINNNLANYCININSEQMILDEFGTNKSLIITLLKKTSNKLESTLNDEEQQNEAKLSTRLIIEVLPNGPKYQIPLQLKLKEVQMENSNSTLTSSTSKNKLQKSSSVTTNLSSTSLRILSSKSIIQFGQCDISDYLVEDLVLMNPNEFNVKCTISISTLNEQQQKCSENMFSFDDASDLKNIFTQIVELKSNQSSSFKIKFQPKSQINISSSLCSGVIKISALNYDLNFIVRLVGFVGKANLFIDNLIKQAHINALAKIKYSLRDSLINVSQKYKLNVAPNSNLKSIQRNKYSFSKEIILKNISSNSKCFFTVLCLDKTFTNKIDSSIIKLNLDDNYMILNENENYALNVEFESTNDKISNLIENNKLTFNLFILWTGFDAFLYCYQLLQQNLRMKQQNEKEVENNENEFDLDMFIVAMMLLKNYNFASNESQQNVSIVSNISSTTQSSLFSLNLANDSIYSQIIKKSKLTKDDLIKYFKSLLNYSIITLVCDFDSQNKPVIPQQTIIANEQLPDIMFRKAPINVNALKTQRYSLSNETIMNHENNNTNGNKLPCSSSCSNLADVNNASKCSINFDCVDTINDTTSLQSIDHLLDFTLNKTNDESVLKNSETLKSRASTAEVGSTTTPSIANSNGWSISPTEINLYINEKNFQKQQATILLINSLNKDLAYDLIYRRVCLTIQPNKGVLTAKGQIKINVKINQEVLSKLPWLGTISILCNKTQKDIRVSINHTSAMTQQLPPLPNVVVSSTNNQSRVNTNNNNNISNASINNLTNTSIKNSTTLEQGTILSEISQHPLDTLSLTPLINASFMQTSGNQFNNISTMSNKTFKQQTNNEFLLSNNTKSLNDSKQSKSNIKIVRIGSDAHITFPNVSVGSSSSAELTLSNPTKNYVRWKSFSTAPAFIRLNDSDLTSNESTNEHKLQILQQSSLYKSSYSVFLINPTSGVIPPSQKQVIKIEFCPREAPGLFTQRWEIDTRTDSFDQSLASEKNFNDSYNCKLVLNGHAVNNTSVSSQQDQKVLTNKENLLGNKGLLLTQNTEKLNNLSKYSNKENSSVLQSTLQPSKNKIYLENEVLEFGNVEPGESNKASLHIKNVENRTCTLQIMKLLEPFYCKYSSIIVKPKHYIRIPIEFKPLLPGDYADKILIRVDSSDAPLSCVLKAKCTKLS